MQKTGVSIIVTTALKLIGPAPADSCTVQHLDHAICLAEKRQCTAWVYTVVLMYSTVQGVHCTFISWSRLSTIVLTYGVGTIQPYRPTIQILYRRFTVRYYIFSVHFFLVAD
jgi:hypothetical protein